MKFDWLRPNQGTLLDQNDEEKADGKTHDPSTDPAEWCSIAELCRTSKLKKLRFRNCGGSHSPVVLFYWLSKEIPWDWNSVEGRFRAIITCRCWTTGPGSSARCSQETQPDEGLANTAWWPPLIPADLTGRGKLSSADPWSSSQAAAGRRTDLLPVCCPGAHYCRAACSLGNHRCTWAVWPAISPPCSSGSWRWCPGCCRIYCWHTAAPGWRTYIGRALSVIKVMN